MKTIKPLLLLILLSASLITACNRQGPMGPEGPQGPDGKDGAGGGDGGVITYVMEGDDHFKWKYGDGWSGYRVMNLDIDEQYEISLPEAASAALNAGGPVLVSLMINNEWHALPYKEDFNNGNGTYNYYVNYEIVNGSLRIESKFWDDVEVEIPDVQQLRVVVAPASKNIPLAL